MLQIDKVQTLEGVTVYGDREKFNVFYPIPQYPRYRRYEDGKLAFSFMKYRFPVDRPDGRKGGGFVLFDVEFVVDPAKLPKIKEALTSQVTQEANRLGISPVPEVVFGTVTYSKGSTQLIVAGSDGLFVEKLHNPGKPSLYGNNVSTFGLELSENGATFFEAAMKTPGGSAVAVVYDLWFWASLPEITVDGYFYASSFYSFYQTIDTDWNFWSEDSYRETIREQLIQSEAMDLDFQWGMVSDEKIRAPIRDWATKALEDAVERKMIKAVAPVPDDQRKAPDGIEDVTRDISNIQISNVNIHYSESQSVEWNIAPPGQLQSIVDQKMPDGSPVKWEDYFHVIDLNDAFFQQLRVDTFVNADFGNLPIRSVEVKLTYNGRPMANLEPNQPEGEVVLNKPDSIGKFAAYVENDKWKYKYSYQVNYIGESRIYQSPEIETNEGTLTIGVDDVGIVAIDIAAGDLDWNDIDRAQVTLTYQDNNVEPFEEQFVLTQAQNTRKIRKVIFEPMRKSYKYKVKYFMKGGKEVEGSEMEGRSQNLFINDVFGGRKTISVRGAGDFTNRIANVFVNLKYTDTKNDYSLARGQALSAATPFFDWSIPVISETDGKVTYSADVMNKDGTSEHIPETEAKSDTILLPPPVEAFMEVTLETALLDWTKLKLVRASMSYTDPDGDVSEAKDFIFSQQKSASAPWKVPLKNKEHKNYVYKITYFMIDGLQKTVGPKDGTDQTLILDPDEKNTEAIRVRRLKDTMQERVRLITIQKLETMDVRTFESVPIKPAEQEAELQEAMRYVAARQEAARKEAARQEAARKETAKLGAGAQEASKYEQAGSQEAIHARAKRGSNIRIEYERTGGFAGIRLAATINTATLPADQAGALHSAIEAAHFFDLAAGIPLPSQGADQFSYHVTIEDGGKRHTVDVGEAAASPALQALLQQLTLLASK
jgi:hypothetical protein